MDNVKANIARIRGFLTEHGWSPFKMAREAKLSPNALLHVNRADYYDKDGVLRMGWNPTAETISKIEGVITEYEQLQRERAERVLSTEVG
jgi:hypothetical protein